MKGAHVELYKLVKYWHAIGHPLPHFLEISSGPAHLFHVHSNSSPKPGYSVTGSTTSCKLSTPVILLLSNSFTSPSRKTLNTSKLLVRTILFRWKDARSCITGKPLSIVTNR
ncbi:hypothetical protein DFH09DRAFT_1002312, partial [Mycena vulgaris]